MVPMVKTNATLDEKTRGLLNTLFYDIEKPSAYTGKENVFRAAKRILTSIKRSDVERWFEEQLPTHCINQHVYGMREIRQL